MHYFTQATRTMLDNTMSGERLTARMTQKITSDHAPAPGVAPLASSLRGKRGLLIVTGGIAAYKTPDLVRRLRERGVDVRCVVTEAGARFVTPLALQAVSENKVYQDLFSLTDESEMGHIRLSREADFILVAPASADFLAKMAHGMADDLASTVLLASDKPPLIAPAMNVRMWEHPAVKANIALLVQRGVTVIGPEAGSMACGEWGDGRMSEPLEIVGRLEAHCDLVAAPDPTARPLLGVRALVTSGPTHEPIDPVRYIANRSSGKQGHAIAAALAAAGAQVTLVSGPVTVPPPPCCTVVAVETARQMLAACQAALPADLVVAAAAVADWRPEILAPCKLKKNGEAPAPLTLAENPDILATLCGLNTGRPHLIVGFAAETDNLLDHALRKRRTKGCDWIVANDVCAETGAGGGVFGGDVNRVVLVKSDSVIEHWPELSKMAVAERLVACIADHFSSSPR
jgi:phosphopantothenoylcysteine decarboxylase / phosphopantothenate---cysteine ligase